MILQKLIQKHSNGEVDMILNGIVGMKSQQIEEDLRIRISKQEWPPGEKMDSCRKLAEQYGCSINTVQKALKNLENNGFVIREERREIVIRGDINIRRNTGLIAAFVPQIDNPLWCSALRGIEDHLRKYNYTKVFHSTASFFRR